MPRFSSERFNELAGQPYTEIAQAVLGEYLTDFTASELERCVRAAYCGTFENDCPAPLHIVDDNTAFLELYHGPTCAFKDMALQLLPQLMSVSAAKLAPGRTQVILVATSGDTGKAALAGFADVPGTKIIVFYPEDGVSSMQKLQMITQTGDNVAVGAIKGNFDDAQSGVKAIFGDAGLRSELAAKGLDFSSANSINFGRLAPQIVYYVAAYCQLLALGKTQVAAGFNIVVPTGNFGNILAAYYAKQLGVPVRKLILGSNRNKVLADFIATGIYDRNREFYQTTSPSMDILISSNLERLLYHLSGNDFRLTADLMEQLKNTGKYTISPELRQKLQAEFAAGWCDDAHAAAEIRRRFAENRYLCDPHTAVASAVLRQYREETGDRTFAVVAATASCGKFAPAVLAALDPDCRS